MQLKKVVSKFCKQYLRIFLLLVLFAVRLFLPVNSGNSIIEKNSNFFSASKKNGDNNTGTGVIKLMALNFIKHNKHGRLVEK